MGEFAPWVILAINTVGMLIGFSTVRRERRHDAQDSINAAVKLENRLTIIESSIKHVMRRLDMHHRGN